MTTAVIEQLPLLAGAPGGVAGLRRLILDLAISGRLVPQNSSDGSAAELISKAAAVKATMGPKRKSRGGGLAPGALPSEDLPSGWVEARLSDLTTKLGAGSTPLGGKQVYTSDGVMFLRSQNVWNDGLRLDDVARIPAAIHADMASTHVVAGDLLFNITGASIGRCGVVPSPFEGGNVSQHVVIVRPALSELQAYLHKVLISTLVQDAVMAEQVGVSREGLSVAKLAEFKIPLPPLAEQHRIVAKVEGLMALCDRLEARQQDAEAARAQLVQALLDSLTQARDAEEFQACWQRIATAFEEAIISEASIDTLIRAVRKLAFQGALSRHGATDWSHVRVSDAVQFLNGYAFKSEWFVPHGIGLVRNVNIAHGYIDWRDAACVPAERFGEFSAFTLFEGDVLLTLDRPIISTGLKVAVVRKEDLPCLLLQRVARLTPKAEQVRPSFLLHWLRSPLFIDAIDPGRSNGVPHISTRQVGSMMIPLPALDEQDRIVARLDELLALCDQLKARIAAARAKHAQLAEALVAQAVAA